MASISRWVAVLVVALFASHVVVPSALASSSTLQDGARDGSAPAGGSAEVRAHLDERIAGVIDEVVDGARAVDDPAFRQACRIGAAALIWPRSPDKARAIYQASFDDLQNQVAAEHDAVEASSRALDNLMAEVARRDPALAEQFASRIADAGRAGATAGPSRSEALVAAGIAMLPNDPARAEALGRLALADGVSPDLVRLAIVMRGVDARRADALYSMALGVFARTPNPALSDVGTLAGYLGANGQSVLENVSPDALRGFLVVAVRLIEGTPLDSEDARTAYFLGRSLVVAVARYAADRSAALDARLGLLSRSAGFEKASSASRPADDAFLNDPHAVAAQAAIDRDDFKTLCAEAAAVENESVRSILFARMAISLLRQKRLSEVAAVVDKVPSAMRRSMLFVQLAYAARSEGDLALASQSLSAAEREALRESNAAFRVQAYFAVVAAWVDVDSLGAFEAMTGCVAALNKASLTIDSGGRAAADVVSRRQTYDTSLGRLAQADFERALLLARQIDDRGYRLLAELAVCRGGLAGAGDEGAEDELLSEDAS